MPVRETGDTMTLSVMGRIAAGTPIEALQEESHQVSVPLNLLGSGEHYALEVKGDSMIEAQIADGDFAVIRKQSTCNDGQIAVALVDGEDATLKYFYREAGHIRLEPANSTMQSIIVSDAQVLGVLVGVIRRY